MGRTGTLHALRAGRHRARSDDDRQGAGRRLPADRRGAGSRAASSTRSTRGSGIFQHGHTYLGHPVACAAALAVQRRDPARQAARQRAGATARTSRSALQRPLRATSRTSATSAAAASFMAHRAGRRPRDQGALRPALKLHARVKARRWQRGLLVLSDGRHHRRRARRPRPARAALHRHRAPSSTQIVERLGDGDRCRDRAIAVSAARRVATGRNAYHEGRLAYDMYQEIALKITCSLRGAALLPRLAGARRHGAAEIRHHRHRRRHRRVLRRGRRDLPAGEQGPRQARHPLLGGIDRRLGVQRQHHQGRRARPRRRAVRRAVQRRQGRRPVQGRRRLRRPALGLCALHPEPFTVLARKEAEHQELRPTSRASSFNVGNPGSGTRASMEELLAAMGWKLSDFALASELKADEHGPALCDGKIDGFYLRRRPPVGQHPGPDHDLRREARADHRPRGRQADDRASPTTPRRSIPGGLYPNNPQATETYGVLATLVTSSKVAATTRLHAGEGDVRQLRGVQEAASGASPI